MNYIFTVNIAVWVAVGTATLCTGDPKSPLVCALLVASVLLLILNAGGLILCDD